MKDKTNMRKKFTYLFALCYYYYEDISPKTFMQPLNVKKSHHYLCKRSEKKEKRMDKTVIKDEEKKNRSIFSFHFIYFYLSIEQKKTNKNDIYLM